MKIAIVRDTVPKNVWAVYWEQACKDKKLDYKKFNSRDPDFMSQILKYQPDRVLWRSGNSPRNKIKDEPQRYLLEQNGLRIVPNWKTHWPYDHKVRETYLFNLHKIPHHKTTIFWQEEDAREYVKKAEYPFVIKADGGAGSKSFKFIESKKQAKKMIEQSFQGPGCFTGRGREKYILYTQEYVKIDFVWRVIVMKDEIGMGYKANFRPGTLKASGQGFLTHVLPPRKLFTMARNINIKLGFDWMAYDIVWNDKAKEYQVLEMCDTVGQTGHGGRSETLYYRSGRWYARKETKKIQEYVFKLFVLDEMKPEPAEPAEAPGC